MKGIRIVVPLVAVSVLAVGAVAYRLGSKDAAVAPSSAKAGPNALPDFELFDTEGHSYQLYRFSDQKAVAIVSFGADCPIVQKSVGAMKELKRELEGKGVTFLALDANTADTREKIKQELKEYGLDWPVLRDQSQLVAKELGFQRTGEAVLVDPKGWKVVYRGAIDDHLDYGSDKIVAKNQYLRDAINDVIGGRAPAVASSKGKGCAISFREDERPLTFTADIAPILRQKCLNCHTEAGQYKPYFTDFSTVKSWTSMIRETVMTQRMPLWGFDSEPGEFINDTSLSPEQKRMLVSWIDAGAPRGEGADPIAGYAPPVAPTDDKDSYAASMNEEFEVPANGYDDYTYRQLGGPIPRDMWVDSIRGDSTNPRAMHHGTVMVTPLPLSAYEAEARRIKEEEDKRRAASPNAPRNLASGMSVFPVNAAIYGELHSRKGKPPQPGSPYRADELIRFGVYSTYGRNSVRTTFSDTAYFLPKGYYLILESHHQSTGKPEKEKTTVYFHETKKRAGLHPVHRLDQTEVTFVVPAGAKNYRVNLKPFVADRDLRVVGCQAHMHVRGRELHSWITHPDGTFERLITVSSFQYDWHPGAMVRFRRPKVVPKGSRIESYGVIDNSPTNPYNPDPAKAIGFGQSLHEDEMPRLQCGFYYLN